MNKRYEIISLRYARAFLEVFRGWIDRKTLDDIEKLQNYFVQHQTLLFFLNISLVPYPEKEKALSGLCKNFDLKEPFKKICMLLIDHQRAFLLPHVLGMIKKQYMKQKQLHEFTVSSSCVLVESEKNSIEKFLQDQLSGESTCSYRVDLSLIAGVRIENGSFLWEHSMKRRLMKLKYSLNTQ